MNTLQHPPDDLQSEEAKEFWAAIVSEWKIDNPASRRVLLTACECLDTMRQAQKEIEEFGLVTLDRFGQKKPSPAAAVLRDARAQLLQNIRALDLDPKEIKDPVPAVRRRKRG